MKLFTVKNISMPILLLYLLLAGSLPSFALADTEMSIEQGFQIVEGKVSDVSIETGKLTVKPNKGKKVMVIVDQETVFIGEAASLSDIEKRHRVKVWYLIEGEQNRALKIEKIADLGC